ncbi:peptidase, S41 family protein [Myxococcus stipitatus DSM 14675]|uniref:Peptidase, S41 family protein n=1 Tax=Myxococcus stipitatus (strain DSM 14675 / JCM 12634 / Mx s8) TaxID=1278073 RepID=L7UCB5_MYXSD|nr:S41 family peptidase [Myxococcus stipitatus]AGC45242.1 peptidase, S41 family protein [Myxococcus stipitatus DSM 14675]
MSSIWNLISHGVCWARRGQRRGRGTAVLLSLLGGSAWGQSLLSAESWCDFGQAGPTTALPAPVALSAAHGQTRFFGTGPGYHDADLALVSALEGSSVDWDAATSHYADRVEGVCALAASSRTLRAAQVLSVGPIAFIRPGTGDVQVPRHSRAVIIDLRELPAAPGLEEALARAIGAVSTAPVARLSERVRHHIGMTDEMTPESEYSAYRNFVEPRAREPYAATGRAELPVALLTGPALAPAAARFAVDLRMAQRAWLVGAPVHTAVAESKWMPVKRKGMLVRTARLEDAQGAVPDVIPVDSSLSHFGLGVGSSDSVPSAQALQATSFSGVPTPVDRTTPVVRNAPEKRFALEVLPPSAASSGIARADLLILHGATRLFFPYFGTVGDGIDDRLLEMLALVDAVPVTHVQQTQRLLLRFNEVLQDGHGFVYARGGPTPAGYFAVYLDEIGGEPVVRRSVVPDVHPGDTVTSVDGVPMAEWLSVETAHASAATPGWKHEVAARRLVNMNGPSTFGLRGVDGVTRFVQVQPQPQMLLGPPSFRGAGSLADLGAPELHYMNLANQVLSSVGQFRAALAAAQGASGLVLDLRGYPNFGSYEPRRRLIPTPFLTSVFRTPVWTGPEEFGWQEEQGEIEPMSNPSFSGPIVLLVGPKSVSASEDFSMVLTGARRVKVVGRRSAGTNGVVARLLMPGGMLAWFTGMEMLFPDRSTFHGVGIVPDIESTPTAVDLAAGRDTELLRAIEYLRTGQ